MKYKSLLIGSIALIIIAGVLRFVLPGDAACPRAYCIQSNTSKEAYAINTPAPYSFAIVDANGNTVKSFATTHTKFMHMIVVRKDLRYFQHVHPTLDPATGVFTLRDFTFPESGDYRIFEDFAPANGQKNTLGALIPVVISEDITVGSTYVPEPLGTEDRTKTFDGYNVTLSTNQKLVSGREATLMFTLMRGNKPVTDLQEYLGALGHSVILKESTLDFIHVHPLQDPQMAKQGSVTFSVRFQTAGRYKMFTQFQRDGKVFTTDFVVSVAEGTASDFSASVIHSMH